MNTVKNSARTILLGVPQVASWQIPGILPRASAGTNREIYAVLPALQRGSVWKPHQTERLWDSLLRGFPIGAFICSKYDKKAAARYGIQEYKLADVAKITEERSQEITHHLLDGQQRATSISLGFFDIWDFEHFDSRKDGPVLWIDLAPAPEKDEREYVLRVLTRSHPWGYKRSNPEERLETKQMRKALTSYKHLAPSLYAATPAQFPLQHAWPWDAQAPIPLALLINAIRSGASNIAAEVKNELMKLPFWQINELGPAIQMEGENLRETLLNALDGRDEKLKHRFDQIVGALRAVVAEDSHFSIPAMILPESPTLPVPDIPRNSGLEGLAEARPDPVETLFIRINSGGTRLEGEELIYSLLKSAWMDAPQAIAKLQPNGHHMVAPARMVILVTRLLIARQQKADEQGKFPDAPPAPDVARFRHLIAEDKFQIGMKTFIGGIAGRIFNIAHQMLVLEPVSSSKGSYRLPPSLAANLTQGTTGADLMLLFLRWVDRMLVAKHNPLELTAKAQARILGFLTGMAWFSIDSGRCLRRLWPKLQACPIEKLPDFFNRSHFKSLIPADSRSGMIFLPVVPPKILEAVIKDRVTGGAKHYGGFRQTDHDFWKAGANWYHYYGWLANDDFNQLNGKLKKWLRAQPVKAAALDSNEAEGVDGTSEGEDSNEVLRTVWIQFLDKIWSERRLLQYVQRDWLVTWFADFDPTLPEQMEDINRPWDYDHIHPHNLISGKKRIPSVVRDWHGSIGNLRIWPLELNRSDQDSSPRRKLNGFGDDEKRYGMVDEKQIGSGSFINNSDWQWWEQSVPDDDYVRYLAQPRSHADHVCRMNLVRAITSRFCRIYSKWYLTLHIGDLS